MKIQTTHANRTDFALIAEAIGFLKDNGHASADEAAVHAEGMVPDRFRELFVRWAGTDPERYVRYIGTEYIAGILRSGTGSRIRLGPAGKPHGRDSGASRRHDSRRTLRRRLLPVRPLLLFGKPVRRSAYGIDPPRTMLSGFRRRPRTDARRTASPFSAAAYVPGEDSFQQAALAAFSRDRSGCAPVRLHLKGTPFQIQVWKALLRIPSGALTTYGELARAIGRPGASRAVGTAVGANPAAYLIPCHRVVRSSGETGGFHWNPDRKTAMIGWEAVRRADKP